MSKCTKARCPMQAGVVPEDCNMLECSFRTPGLDDNEMEELILLMAENIKAKREKSKKQKSG